MSKESCVVEKELWGNTDNVYKPIVTATFLTLDEALAFVRECKDYKFAYMHKLNIKHTIEDI